MVNPIKPRNLKLAVMAAGVITLLTLTFGKVGHERNISSPRKVGHERIMSRPKWNFDKSEICKGYRDETYNNGDIGPFIKDHQLPSKGYLCSLSMEHIEKIYAWYFNNIQTRCTYLKRFGKAVDGGWDVCLDKDLIQQNKCLVYSFGINYDFSFDDDISEQWGCTVHSFDPSMDTASYQRSPRVHFHNIGLANYNGTTSDAEWKMLTLQGIRQELNHQKVTPDIIKMDIEDWEWYVIPEMLSSSSLNGVKQFLVEFHFSNIPDADTEAFWLSKLFYIKELYSLGYRITWVTRNLPNVWTSRNTGKEIYGCVEVAFIRKN